MNTHADKSQENKGQSVADVSPRKQTGSWPSLQLGNFRPEAILQRKLQEMADKSSAAIQRQVDVYVQSSSTSKKKMIVARGDVEDFKEGTDAGDKGWLGVDKYRARYQVESTDGKYMNKGSVGPLKNIFTEANRGHVLAKRNGGDGQDEENIFAQDGGANNGTYKAFESEMSSTLDKYDDNDDVTFVCYLEGNHIYQGNIADAAESEASDISSDEMDTESD